MKFCWRVENAVEACNYGLVTQVFPQAEFDREVKKRMKHLVGLPPKVRLKKIRRTDMACRTISLGGHRRVKILK